MADLSGVMDSAGGYSVCIDAADEELHFSRDTFFQARNGFLNGQLPKRQGSLSITIDQINPTLLMNTNNNNNPNFHDINLATGGYISLDQEHSERVKSTRLLNSIGSKIRRGSNYLIAPKLLGEYLLGITIQSWPEFLNSSRMLKAPSNRQQLTRRLVANLNYFQGNYLCVSLILIIYCILTSPLLLLAIVAYFLTLYFITARSATGRALKIMSFKPNLQQQYSFVTILSVPLLWVAGAPSAVFWVIGASFVVVGLHASMYNNEKLYQTFEEPAELQRAPYQADQNSPALNQTGRQLSRAGQPTPSSPAVQYYNHYSLASNHFLPAASPNSPSAVRKASWSQWVPFGGSLRASKLEGADKANQPQSSSKSQHSAKIQNEELMIISQDYAGLGRVYEV